MLKINTVTMEDKIFEILGNYGLPLDEKQEITKKLLDLFPVMKCRCIHEIHERFPSELINKKCNDCGGVL